MSMTPPLKPGDPLSIGWLNGSRDLAGSGRLKVAAETGLRLIVLPFMTILAGSRPPDGWYKVTAAVGMGQYTLAEEVPAPSGAWAAGPRTSVNAYEANLNAGVPTGAYVWLRYRKGAWRFTYGACS